MKSKRILAVALIAIMTLTLITACKKDGDDGLYETPEFVFVPESVALPSEINDIRNMAYSDGKLIFVVSNYDYDEVTFIHTPSSKLMALNIDEIDIKSPELHELTGYVPPAVEADIPPGITPSGGVMIDNMKVDEAGNIWVVENYNFSYYDIPEHDKDTEEPWQYYKELGSGSFVRKLDPTGAELLKIDNSNMFGQQNNFYVRNFNIDGDGNLYFAVDDWENDKRTIYVLDKDGNKHCEINSDSWIDELIRMPDGSLAFMDGSVDENGNYVRSLRSIDFAAKALGTATPIPDDLYYVYPGNEEYGVLLGDNDNIYAFTFGEEEPVKLLNWMESDIVNNGIDSVILTADGRIICAQYNYNRISSESNCELLILTKTPYSELPEKTILTLAANGTWQIRDAVVNFNRTSDKYRIQVADYSQFNTQDDYNAGITRLSTEIISGKVPDILVIEGLPYNDYVKKGLLVDLYPYLDNDPEISRNDFVENVLQATEVNGGLYQMYSSFGLYTIVGHPSVVGQGPGWTMEEFRDVLNAHPDADIPLGQWGTKSQFLEVSVAFGIHEYIDWAEGKAYFDSDAFINLLEYCSSLPADIDYDSITDWESFYINEEESIPSGRQIMATMGVNDLYQMKYYQHLFGGEIAFKGFPSNTGNGVSLGASGGFAISDKCKYKDGAWEFIRSTLTKDYQVNNQYYWGWPTNKQAFDMKIQEALDMQEGSYGYNSVNIDVPSQKDVDQLMELIKAASGTTGWNLDPTVREIVMEETAAFFAGGASAEDTARVIQNRVSILVSERS